MTGVLDKNGDEIQEGNTILFGLRPFKVVFLQECDCEQPHHYGRAEHREANRGGEHLAAANGRGHNGFYAEERAKSDDGEEHIHRILLLAMNPANVSIIRGGT